MSVRDAWREAFPEQAARDVVTYVVNTWQALTAEHNPHLNWGLKEPDITKRFKQHLENGAEDAGLTGGWGSEGVSMHFDQKTGAPLRAWRTDITYHSDRDPQRVLRLTFEFKKLKHTNASRKAYYGGDGMGRFLRGDYGRRASFGLMVGIIESESHRTNIDKLKHNLRDEQIGGTLGYIPDEHTGKWVREPSREMPGLAEFDTQHHRSAGSTPVFMFSHMFFSFPEVA